MASTKLSDAHPRLAEAFATGKALYEHDHPGQTIITTCTYRSAEEQQALYEKGRTKPGQIVTQINGADKLSKHNVHPSHALDFAIIIGGKLTWDEAEYNEAGPYFEAEGLVWGGNWKTFRDRPHLELSEVA